MDNQALMQDVLINAELWGDAPALLSANYGFEGLEGVPGYQAAGEPGKKLLQQVQIMQPIRHLKHQVELL